VRDKPATSKISKLIARADEQRERIETVRLDTV
jgi:hypothetical protein